MNVDEILNNTFSQSYSCNFKGGVVDHGDFLEGFCFKIKSYNFDKKINVEWELCSDNKVSLLIINNYIYILTIFFV